MGRAVPEVDQYSILVAGISVLPAAADSPFGDQVILETIAEPSREEEILRVISTVSESNLNVADGAIPGSVAKRPGVLVTGSLTRAREVGRAVRVAAAAGGDAIQAVLKAAEGYLLFRDRIADYDSGDEGGFLVGEITIAGSGRYQGSRYRIRFKNENVMAWEDETPSVMAHDLVILVSASTGRAITNPDFERGQEVAALGFKAPPALAHAVRASRDRSATLRVRRAVRADRGAQSLAHFGDGAMSTYERRNKEFSFDLPDRPIKAAVDPTHNILAVYH